MQALRNRITAGSPGQAARALVARQPLYFGVVIAPLLLMLLYFGLIANDGYLSRAQLIVERDAQSGVPGMDLGLLGLSSGSSKLDPLLIKEFITSRAMLDHLQKTLDLRAHYSGDGPDFLASLDEDASQEDFHEYFLDHLTVKVNPESLVIDLEVAAYEPVFTQRIAQQIVKRSEEFVNEISRQMAREQLAFVQSEVDAAAKRMQQASDELIQLQRQHEVLSPEAESESSSRIISELQAMLAKKRTELKTLQSYLNSAAPEVTTTRRQAIAIERQLDQERRRQVGVNEPGVNDLVLRYQSAQLAVQLGGDLYQAALKSLEVTRLDASRKAKYLVQVSPPNLPDEAELPRSWRTLFAALVLLNLGYFVVSLLIAVVRDHRD